ncbi:Trm112 family protein [Solihabitans fulvus]|uniref:UPF0434 protein F0L68_19235 n=1 Tax=Solihabitans fulvus TaxID=1892852 RepID=A0A5B2XBC3_9PSEU|nr:Trm112 family protein [Solihabitans fulvus]KAA2260937.1 Trm112 family protein [Solihabitans fulvus]
MAVQLDPQLLEILACPCPEHAPLQVGTPEDAMADFLTCTSCGRAFPVRDGIPVLLLDEAVDAAAARQGAGDGAVSARSAGSPADGDSTAG